MLTCTEIFSEKYFLNYCCKGTRVDMKHLKCNNFHYLLIVCLITFLIVCISYYDWWIDKGIKTIVYLCMILFNNCFYNFCVSVKKPVECFISDHYYCMYKSVLHLFNGHLTPTENFPTLYPALTILYGMF